MATHRLIVEVIGIFIILGLFYIALPGGLTGEAVVDVEQPSIEVVSGTDAGINIPELGEKFLTTKSTGENDLGCGPPDDFDCGLNRYSGYMALANIEAYQNVGDRIYLDYAIRFAMAEQTHPPAWCPTCICQPPDDFDCGTGEVQAEMIEVFARLYELTHETAYLDYAERFASTQPSEPAAGCPGCTCGPPDDFDCGKAYVQTSYLSAYKRLYDITRKNEYLGYIRGLGDAWLGKSMEEIGPRLIGFLLEVSWVTGDTTRADRAILLGSEMMGENCDITIRPVEHADYDDSAYLDAIVSLFQHTGEEKYLDCARKIVEESEQCPERVCLNMVEQASMIRQNIRLFKLSENQEFLRFAEEFAELDNINAVSGAWVSDQAQCRDFDCQDAEGQAFIAHALLELVEAKGETTE